MASTTQTSAASTDPQLNYLFDRLWDDYIAFNPQAKRVHDVILKHEQQVDPSATTLVNDHIALRTFDHPKINLDRLGAIFKKYGYREGGEYEFKEKKLFARHFEHADPKLPKVFISELLTNQFSPLVRQVVEQAVSVIKEEDVQRDDFLWSRRKWNASHATYQQLLNESEYAAWMYAFGFRSNHFTISFNSLKSFRDLQSLNAFIESQGYALNSAGGVIKGTPDQLLEQSSTLAEKTKLQFDEGLMEVPACYYEFARRYPQANGELYRGFIAASADKIFESTNVRR